MMQCTKNGIVLYCLLLTGLDYQRQQKSIKLMSGALGVFLLGTYMTLTFRMA